MFLVLKTFIKNQITAGLILSLFMYVLYPSQVNRSRTSKPVENMLSTAKVSIRDIKQIRPKFDHIFLCITLLGHIILKCGH